MTVREKRILTAWAAWIGINLAADWVLNTRKSGLTLSEAVRAAVRETPNGKWVLAVILAATALWFWCHIIRPLENP
jgi:hypothetical protein